MSRLADSDIVDSYMTRIEAFAAFWLIQPDSVEIDIPMR